MSRVLLIGLVLALVGALPASARPLKGRLFLGRELSIFIEEDESLVTDLLRSVSLMKSEVPVVNLSAAALRPDQLAIGRDRKLYAADGGAWVVAGEADDVSNLKLADGVELELVRDVVGAFAGDAGEKLAVRVPAGCARVAAPPFASFADWLGELDAQGAALGAGKVPPASYVFLFNAVAGSLPVGGESGRAASENFRALKAYVERGTAGATTPFGELLKRLRKDSQVKLVASKSHAEPAAGADRLMQAYEALENALHAR